MSDPYIDLSTVSTGVVNVLPGATNAFFLDALNGQVFTQIKNIGNTGAVELIQTTTSASLSPSDNRVLFASGSTQASSMLAALSGKGYPLAANEVVTINGPCKFYISAPSATCTVGFVRGLSGGSAHSHVESSAPAAASFIGPISTVPYVWLKSDAASVIKDGSNLVSQLTDQSGNSRHFIQPTGGNQPTWTSSGIGGVASIQGAAGKFLYNTGSWFPATSTIFMVIKYTNVDLNANEVWIAVNSDITAYQSNAAFLTNVGAWCINRSDTTNGGTLDNNGHVMVIEYNSAANTVVKQEATQVISVASAGFFNVMQMGIMGGYANASLNWTGQFAELLLYDVALSASDKTTALNSLKTKYGIS